MFVVHPCARCRHLLRIRRCYQGKTVRCPGCAAMLTVPLSAAAGSDPCVRRKVRAAPCACGNSEASAGHRRPSHRLVLPWLLLAPALVALGLLAWAGHGVLWAALGVGLASLFLFVGQRACWPLSLRVGPSLSLAALGHGLTLAGPHLNVPLPQPLLAAAGQSIDAPPLTLSLSSQPAGPSPTRTSLTNQSRSSNQPAFPDLVPVAVPLGALLAVAVDADAGGGNAFITTVEGLLKQFSYPAFQLQATYRLPQPAYRAVMDERRGLLWVAASDPGSLRVNNYGDRPEGLGDLHVYDIRALGHPTTTGVRLQPRHVLPLQGAVLELIASNDGRWLFYLARTAEGVHLGRIDAEKHCLDARLPLPTQTQALCRTPDGKTLYAAGGRNVFVLDSASFRLRRRLKIDGDFNAIAADNGGRVYLAEQGQWTSLTCLDLNGSQPTLWQWDPKLHGRLYLRLAPDQHRLYVGTSSVFADHLDSLLTRGHEGNTLPQVGTALSNAQGLVRGEFFLTSDGHHLINRWGRVFRLAQGEMSLPVFRMVREPHE